MLGKAVTAILYAMTLAVALGAWVVAVLTLSRLALWLAAPLLGA